MSPSSTPTLSPGCEGTWRLPQRRYSHHRSPSSRCGRSQPAAFPLHRGAAKRSRISVRARRHRWDGRGTQDHRSYLSASRRRVRSHPTPHRRHLSPGGRTPSPRTDAARRRQWRRGARPYQHLSGRRLPSRTPASRAAHRHPRHPYPDRSPVQAPTR